MPVDGVVLFVYVALVVRRQFIIPVRVPRKASRIVCPYLNFSLAVIRDAVCVCLELPRDIESHSERLRVFRGQLQLEQNSPTNPRIVRFSRVAKRTIPVPRAVGCNLYVNGPRKSIARKIWNIA